MPKDYSSRYGRDAAPEEDYEDYIQDISDDPDYYYDDGEYYDDDYPRDEYYDDEEYYDEYPEEDYPREDYEPAVSTGRKTIKTIENTGISRQQARKKSRFRRQGGGAGSGGSPGIFWKFYFVLLASLGVVIILSLIYVYRSLIKFEANQPGIFVENLISDAALSSPLMEQVKKYSGTMEHNRKFEGDEVLVSKVSAMLSSGDVTFKSSAKSYDANRPYYDIFSDGKYVMTLELRAYDQETRIGIMTISSWEVYGISYDYGSSGSLDMREVLVQVPDSYSVEINGIAAGSDELEGEPQAIRELEEVSQYIEVPHKVTYHISNLLTEPIVTVKNQSGEPVELVESDGKLQPKEVFTGTDDLSAVESLNLNPLQIGRDWSKFLTQDLPGPSNGVAEVQKYMIKDSYMYKMARSYATGIDITFTSNHTLDSFTNENVSNYIKYSDNCFSVDVYLEKNMTLTRNGEKRTDIFNSRMYFINPEGSSEWFWVDMQAVIEE